MKIVTDRVHPDEKCWGLQEVNRLVRMPDGKASWRRVQALYVLRGDSIAEYTTDLGPAYLFENVPELKLLTSAGEHDSPEDTVGQVREEAERSRYDTFERDLRAEIKGTSTLIADFLREKDENWARINNRSQFGPHHNKQRNGYSKPR